MGLAYDRAVVGAVTLVPKLVGSYECELHPVLEELGHRHYDRIVDLGCAEGYYAVGLARHSPQTPVVAADISVAARRLCDRVRVANTAANVDIRGALGPSEVIASVAGRRTLLVCDVEGAEEDLLLAHPASGYESTDLLVELHDFARPGVTDRVVEHFSDTHTVRLISPEPRIDDNFAQLLAPLPRDLWSAALDEGRPAGIRWMWAQALGATDV